MAVDQGVEELTLRDVFACVALYVVLSKQLGTRGAAKAAWEIANEMLDEREASYEQPEVEE